MLENRSEITKLKRKRKENGNKGNKSSILIPLFVFFMRKNRKSECFKRIFESGANPKQLI